MSCAVPRVVLEEPEDEIVGALREAQLLLLKHAVAAQAAFAAFVAEGRRFATTAEGRAWHAALVDSALVRRGRALWDGSALTMLQESPYAVLPSSLLDAIVGATASGELGVLLGRVFQDARFDPAHGE